MSIQDARKVAEDEGVDLVMIAPTAKPPVCRVVDYGKFKYEQLRKEQVGTGDRSERIRTYNYPQGRVTDHRIGLTLYKIDDILNGNIDEIIDALITADRTAKLEENSEI